MNTHEGDVGAKDENSQIPQGIRALHRCALCTSRHIFDIELCEKQRIEMHTNLDTSVCSNLRRLPHDFLILVFFCLYFVCFVCFFTSWYFLKDKKNISCYVPAIVEKKTRKLGILGGKNLVCGRGYHTHVVLAVNVRPCVCMYMCMCACVHVCMYLI